MSLDSIVSVLLDGLSFVLVLGVAVLIHEAGHFFLAIWSGVKVEKFSIGFGNPIFSFHYKGVEYVIAWIPMGGFVKMAGENPSETTGADDEFYSISPWKRIPIVVAGPAFNIIGAFLIFFGISFVYGTEYDYDIVGTVIPGSIADQAGFKTGDVLVSTEGNEIKVWNDFEKAIQEARDRGEESIPVKIKRGSSEETLELAISDEALDKVFVINAVDLVGPAFELGVRDFDRVVSVNGYQPDTWTDFTQYVRKLWEEKNGEPVAKTVTFTWESGGEIKSASLTPAIVTDATGNTIAQIGIGSAGLGMSPEVPPIVSASVRGLPAREAGIESGAKIVAINGELVNNRDDIQRVITFSYEQDPKNPEAPPKPIPVELTWKNPDSDELITKKIKPDVLMTPFPSTIGKKTAKEVPIARLGITFKQPTRSEGLIGSLKEGAAGVSHALDETVNILVGLFNGSVNSRLIGGPVAIVQMSAQIGREGLRRLLWFCAFLQVNLAILNLLPIPILDGGHLVVSLVEGISRRTFSIRTREVIQYIGLAFLLPLFLFVFINDFARIG
ncbi:MAG: RIP metalloprotease RseP, partial [Candidatus Omnitrophica bacterium]|nr:RIP metalloprotease RseP [Candidatus Omnitrophota bacterium]